MHKLEIYVPRIDKNLVNLAIIKAKTKHSSVDAFKNALRNALTAWVKETDEGKQAWEYSSEDFNVGDLTDWTDTQSLILYLSKYDIYSLSVDILTLPQHNWMFDEVLVNDLELE